MSPLSPQPLNGPKPLPRCNQNPDNLKAFKKGFGAKRVRALRARGLNDSFIEPLWKPYGTALTHAMWFPLKIIRQPSSRTSFLTEDSSGRGLTDAERGAQNKHPKPKNPKPLNPKTLNPKTQNP